ncbi:hypothetical protein K461DRAFT_232319 [Myriangium duriaei CBS 260.36]|uniref:Importin N-terminal domain-containing protein n=1 Tax=Myriangium duriaei CBS 260.36 TaxID=1168546 RepID=A0A9P4MIJ0_9PEZI|nr:hypothetical protein K461DRAFT_232319 [Myriangium duriaei CBS 260.36]
MPSANGSNDIEHVERALEASYDPRTSNDQRQEALRYLDGLMNSREAPKHGFALVTNASLPPQARLFGLTLLENSLVRRWSHHSAEEADLIRQWVIDLAQSLRPQDPSYIRLKIASLWVVLAERAWASTWSNLDAMLQELWDAQVNIEQHTSNRIFVLYILECLSENICVREDPIAMLRQEVLGQSLNEVFIPPGLYQRHKDERDNITDMRHGNEGWILRICTCLKLLTSQDHPGARGMIVRALEALKPTVTWISLEAIIEARCVDCVFQALAYGDDAIRVAAIELLLAILSRNYNPHFVDSWKDIYRSAIASTCIETLKRTYSATETHPDDVDETKYTVQKKLSEVVGQLGDAVNKVPEILDDENHVVMFYQFAIDIFKSNSLLVSIPVLHNLSQTLAIKQPKIIPIIQQGASQMFDTCVERMIKFESLSKDTEHPILSYLRDDFETMPEMHAFLGNYRRYCSKVVEHLSEERPISAVQYLLQQATATFKSVEQLRESTYTKHAIPLAQLEANATAVKSGLSGYRHWLISKNPIHSRETPRAELQKEVEESAAALGAQCMEIANTVSEHPDVARIACQLMGDTLLHIQRPDPGLVRGIVEQILKGATPPTSQNSDFAEAIKQLEAARLYYIQSLAVSFPDAIYENHSDIFTHLDLIWRDDSVDDKIRWGYKAIQVITTQRSMQLNESTRVARLQPLLEPVANAWSSAELTSRLSSFQSFCSLIGLDDLMAYVRNARFSTTQDWSNAKLDDAGVQFRSRINAALTALPVRMTTSLLAASSENLKEDSTNHRVGARLWQEIMPIILPNVLSLLNHSTAFSSDESWSQLPADFQSVIRKMLVDRFWQSGISNETKDEFTARVSGSSSTYEGFASNVRGAPRQVRDGCYHIIHGLTRFDKVFFAIPNLAQTLAEALFGNAHWLSTHHLQRLVSLLDRLVSRCPPPLRRSFLPPLISLSFSCFHTKLTREWESIELARTDDKENESSGDLGEEMKADSVVRATTHSFVTFAHKILSNSAMLSVQPQGAGESLKTAILTSPEMASPVLEFLIASLRMRDSRCVAIATQIFRSFIPFIAQEQEQNPALAEMMTAIQYKLSTDALQTAITSLNEPHFVDIHKDLAWLIASIIHNCSGGDDIPARVLASLQGMEPDRVRIAVDDIRNSKREREQRGIVLELLEGIRGVRISEMGKVGIGGNREDAAQKAKREKGKWLSSGGMEVETAGIVRGNTPPEGGLGAMFGD